MNRIKIQLPDFVSVESWCMWSRRRRKHYTIGNSNDQQTVKTIQLFYSSNLQRS